MRNDIFNKNIVDENFKLTMDYEFSSLSSASACITGKSSQGTVEWKLSDGRPVKDLEDFSEDVNQIDIEDKYIVLNKFLENIDILNQLKEETKFNLFETLSIVKTEIRHSNVIGWLLNPYETHGLGQKFVKNFIRDVYLQNKTLYNRHHIFSEDIFLFDFDEIKVYRENQNIDILLVDEINNLVVIIENKVDSREHSNQLEKYEAIIKTKFSKFKKMFIFLTKEGEESSRPDTWGSYSYDNLASIIDDLVDESTSSVQTFLKDYKTIIRRHIMQDEKLKQICENIYRIHKKALDLIFEYRPDIISEIGTKLKDKLRDFDDINENVHNKRIIRFTDSRLRELNAFFEGQYMKWADNKSVILHEFKITDKNVRMITVVGPTKENQRDKLIYHYTQKTGENLRLMEKWTTLHSTLILKLEDDIELSEVDTKLEKSVNKINLHLEKIKRVFEDFNTDNIII